MKLVVVLVSSLLLLADPVAGQEPVAPPSTAEIMTASTWGSVIGVFPGAIAGLLVLQHPVGIGIGAGAGMVVGSYRFLRHEDIESDIAIGAVAAGFVAAIGTAKLIGITVDDGPLLLVIPLSHGAVSGIAASLRR